MSANSGSVSFSSSSDGIHGGAMKEENKSHMRLIAGTLKELCGDVGSWSLGDLTLGLHYLKKEKKRQALEVVVDKSEGMQPNSWMEEMRYWLDIIEGTYKGSEKKGNAPMCEYTGIPEEDVIVSDWKSTTLKPGYYVAKLPAKKKIVFAIRGTANIKDAMTDVTAAQNDWIVEGERVHRGMELAVRWFEENVFDTIKQAVADNPGYEVMVVGHSLGGGTASLSTLLLRDQGVEAKGVVIAPAAVLSLGAARAAAEHITTFILADDLVPRFSVGAVETLRMEIVNFPWADAAIDSIKANRLVKACSDNPVGEAIGAGMSSAYKGASAGAAAVGRGFSAMSSKVGSMWGKKKGSDDDEEEKEALALNEMTDEEKEKIVTLYPPGKVYWVERDLSDGSYLLVERDNDDFGAINLSDTMFSDHSSSNYIDSLDRILGRKPMVDSKSDAADDGSSSS